MQCPVGGFVSLWVDQAEEGAEDGEPPQHLADGLRVLPENEAPGDGESDNGNESELSQLGVVGIPVDLRHCGGRAIEVSTYSMMLAMRDRQARSGTCDSSEGGPLLNEEKSHGYFHTILSCAHHFYLRPYCLCLVLSLFTGALTTHSWAHQVQGANLQLIAELRDDVLIYEVSAETSLVPPLAEIVFGTDPLPDTESLREVLERFFREHCPVLIDGIAVAPVLEDLQLEPMENQVNLGEVTDFVMAYFIFNYPLKTKPQKIDMTWGIFLPEAVKDIVPQTPDPTGHDPQTVDSVFYTYGELDLMTFTPNEPQYIWHTPAPILSVDAAARLRAAAETASQVVERTFSLAWPLAGILALCALALFIGRRVRWAVAFLLASAAAMAAYKPLTISLGATTPDLPEEMVVQRFKDLHQNIYRAFDYDTDEEIYDTLDQSVSGDLLDEIYQEIYKSLILRDEGGAVCRVKKLEYLQCALVPADEDSRYAVQAHWRVFGLVNHFEHTHERVNEYHARYEIAPESNVWKIVDVEITKEQRLNPSTLNVIN